jgi:hypothetical protein
MPKLEDVGTGSINQEKMEAWHTSWNFGTPSGMSQYAESVADHNSRLHYWSEDPVSRLVSLASYWFWILAFCAQVVALWTTVKMEAPLRNRILSVCTFTLLVALCLTIYVLDGFVSAL